MTFWRKPTLLKPIQILLRIENGGKYPIFGILVNRTSKYIFFLCPGMVLVRSESGQLILIPQQALQQMQSQAQSQGTLTSRSATPTSAPPVQISTVQVR